MRKLCFNILMGFQYERPWLKGLRKTLFFGTFYSQCHIMFNISSETNDVGFNGFQNMYFYNFSHLNA